MNNPTNHLRAGLAVHNFDGTHVGKTTGATRVCRLDGCTGIRLVVRWDNGDITYPCTKGMEFDESTESWTIQ